jgi:hypothetical protein
MSDDRTPQLPEPKGHRKVFRITAEATETSQPPEPKGHREVFRISAEAAETTSISGHLLKTRFDNERQEWVIEAITHDDATRNELAKGPLERRSCYIVTDWPPGISSARCEADMCNVCIMMVEWDWNGNAHYWCKCMGH